ncbi:MAG TPA: class I SAM-dependent methyltransferase [Vicinamibacterales bacterium]|jgi:Trans-aconitate methyltransferase
MSGFDRFARSYDADLNAGLSVTGEDKHFFARERLLWLRRRLQSLDVHITTVMDFGCGPGSTTPLLREAFDGARVFGVDVSTELLDIARADHTDPDVTFMTPDSWPSHLTVDLVYSSGVFHHIDPEQRPHSLNFISRSLRNGGVFALWENNPWNPGTRFVMSRIPFDHDAVTLSARQAVRLLNSAGLTTLAVDHAFIFPRALKRLRPLEPWLAGWPLGGQYQVLATR